MHKLEDKIYIIISAHSNTWFSMVTSPTRYKSEVSGLDQGIKAFPRSDRSPILPPYLPYPQQRGVKSELGGFTKLQRYVFGRCTIEFPFIVHLASKNSLQNCFRTLEPPPPRLQFLSNQIQEKYSVVNIFEDLLWTSRVNTF